MNGSLNDTVDFVTRANSTYQPLNPKPGLLIIGDHGVEFLSKNGQGFIQIPWHTIQKVHVQLLFKGRYVRGFFIETSDEHRLEFIVSKGKDCLRAMYRYLSRNQFVVKESNFKSLFKFRK
ncbi:DUF956 family protein [Dolosicoccus paucivorans]